MTLLRCPAWPTPITGAPLRRTVLLSAATLLAALAGPVPAAEGAAPLPAVVVWDFDNQTVPALSGVPAGAGDWLQRSLSENLVGALLQSPGQRVVDRLQLRAVLAEQKLGGSDLADESARLRLGRIVGAQRMVFGGFFIVGGEVQVNVRVVDTTSSRVLFSDEATAPLDAVMQQQARLAERVVRVLGGGGGGGASAGDYAPALWQAHDRALALADAGHFDLALAALQALLTSHPGFAPAERLVPALLQSMARR